MEEADPSLGPGLKGVQRCPLPALWSGAGALNHVQFFPDRMQRMGFTFRSWWVCVLLRSHHLFPREEVRLWERVQRGPLGKDVGEDCDDLGI